MFVILFSCAPHFFFFFLAHGSPVAPGIWSSCILCMVALAGLWGLSGCQAMIFNSIQLQDEHMSLVGG